MKRVLVGSAIYQKPEILQKFLTSLSKIVSNNILVDFIFVDDNVDPKSKDLLSNFEKEGSSVKIIQGQKGEAYLCNEETHV